MLIERKYLQLKGNLNDLWKYLKQSMDLGQRKQFYQCCLEYMALRELPLPPITLELEIVQ